MSELDNTKKDVKTYVSTKFVCPDCKRNFRSRQSYDYHLNRDVCKKHICRFCGLRLRNSQSLRYHISHRVCLGSKKIPVTITERPLGTVYACTKTIHYSEFQLDDLLKFFPNFSNDVFNLPLNQIIPYFIEIALCNKKLPQYWSVYISNKLDQTINVYRSSQWELEPRKKGITLIIQWALSQLTLFCSRYADRVSNMQIEHFDKLKTLLYDQHSSLMSDTINELFCLFYNHRTLMRVKLSKKNRTFYEKIAYAINPKSNYPETIKEPNIQRRPALISIRTSPTESRPD